MGTVDRVAGRRRRQWGLACGTTLIEALVAAAVTAGGVMAVAQLVSLALGANMVARHTTLAVVLAEQKLEELHGATAAVQASPPASLDQHTAGFAEYLDEAGRVVIGDPTDSSDAVYERRWSVTPVPVSAGGAVRIHVLVSPFVGGSAGRPMPGAQYGQAALAAISTWGQP